MSNLVVHLGGGHPPEPGHPLDETRHVRVNRRPGPSPLPGADLVVTHGVVALTLGAFRARRHGVAIRCQPASSSGLDRRMASLLRVPLVEPAMAPVPKPPPSRPHEDIDLGTRCRVLPAATRATGDHLLVAGPGSDQGPLELVGAGPRVWRGLQTGATLGAIVHELVADTGVDLDDVERSVLAFARSLGEAGLIEPR